MYCERVMLVTSSKVIGKWILLSSEWRMRLKWWMATMLDTAEVPDDGGGNISIS